MAESIICQNADNTFIFETTAPQDHIFYNHPKMLPMPKFIKALNNDLKIIQSGLPDGIWVKHFGDRMELLSAMIRGPTETIYEDGLFVFDIFLPVSYPDVPPIFHYHSRSQAKINPNLYTNGKVCLSLLGTWSGTGSECWNNQSTIFQALVSIQALVLVKEPYYNEPGVSFSVAESKYYNFSIFDKVIDSLISLGKNPPTSFKKEIKNHILSVKHQLYLRLNHWRNGDYNFLEKCFITKLATYKDLTPRLNDLFNFYSSNLFG